MSTGLRTELANLLANIDRTDDLMGRQSAEFWRRGGVCCPDCGVPGYSELGLKQERRWKRVAEVRAKLRRDSGEPEPTAPAPAPAPAAPPPPSYTPMTDAQLLALKAKREKAKEVEARVSAKLMERLSAYVQGGLTMRPNDRRTLSDLQRIVAEVIDAEVPPPPFEVLVDTSTDPNRVQVNFAYPMVFYE